MNLALMKQLMHGGHLFVKCKQTTLFYLLTSGYNCKGLMK